MLIQRLDAESTLIEGILLAGNFPLGTQHPVNTDHISSFQHNATIKAFNPFDEVVEIYFSYRHPTLTNIESTLNQR